MPAQKELRYATRRRNRRGDERWYWQRPGHPLERLPDDLVARVAALQRLNAAADRRIAVEPERGTIGWVIREYLASDDYRALAPNSVRNYRPFIADILATGSALPFSSFTRRAVVEYVESYPRKHQRRLAATVLKNLFRLARYHALVAVDETANLRLRTDPPRDRLWTDEEIERWLSAAAGSPHMVTGFLLLQYAAQRPVDVLKMTWAQYSGSSIRLRQQKTGALIEVPLHPALRDHLASLDRTNMMIVSHRGRPVSYVNFNRRFRRISRLAGIDAQARDLRRTAMIRMAEAGATAPMIASVSGHSIDRCARILETYLPRGRVLAEAAITKLAEHKRER
jgi:Phage integrase family